MVDGTSTGTDGLSPPVASPRRSTRRGRVRRTRTIFPTVFGAVVIATVVSSGLFRLAVADPSVMGLVWAGLASVAVVGVAFPIISLGFMRTRVLEAPVDLFVGQLSTLELELTGRASGLRMRCGRSPMFILDLTSPSTVRLPLQIASRGAFDHVPIEVSTDAPFSILTVSERRVLPLRRQMLVGPVVIPGVAEIGRITGEDADLPALGHAMTGDTVRSVRPYVSGDASHMVHWPSSARVGSLVVRELEPPATEGVALVLGLTGENGDAQVEDAVSRAAGIGINALERGARLVLCINTDSGPLREEIADRMDLQRRLALAVPGPPGLPPEGWPAQSVASGLGGVRPAGAGPAGAGSGLPGPSAVTADPGASGQQENSRG